MNLTTKIKTNFKISSESDSDFVIKVLREEGLNIINEKELAFSEKYNFTTHTGKNQQKLFFPLLRGNLKTETKNRFTHWNLQIDEILIKSSLITVLSFLIFHFIFNSKLLFSILVAILIGGFIFIINKERLDNRIKKISKIIEQKL